jgi:hypothetical protein
MDRRKVLIGVCIGAIAIAVTIVILQPRTPELVIGLAVIFGAMIYPQYALTVAHANDFAAPDEFVKIAGGLLLLLGFGTMVGPIVAAQAMQSFMPEGLFAFTACAHIILGVYTLFRMTRRGAPQGPAFRGVSVAKGGTTPESVVLDPRAGEVAIEDPVPAAPPEPAADEGASESERPGQAAHFQAAVTEPLVSAEIDASAGVDAPAPDGSAEAGPAPTPAADDDAAPADDAPRPA